ncbi:hypothetical protein [Hoeflea sp.]|uniref:hypothetical protein n=1 Tax=Hoeflea sp. TaxID=1940281 RepID=UPI003BB15F03
MTLDTNLDSRVLGEPAFPGKRHRSRTWPAAIKRTLFRGRRPGMPEIAVLLVAATAAEIAAESAANLILMATPAMAGQQSIDPTGPSALLPVTEVALPDPVLAGVSQHLANREHSEMQSMPHGSVCTPPAPPEE